MGGLDPPIHLFCHKAGACGQPFATIQRWAISDSEHPDKSGRPAQAQLLIVTRLDPACHAAYVDVRANPETNVLARQAADQHARAFDCKNPALVIGKRGRAVELATP